MMQHAERGITQPGEPVRMSRIGKVCGQEHGPAWCEVEVFSRGLCRKHYRQRARGAEEDRDDTPQVGVTPSGHGLWGHLTIENGRLVCHECGRSYLALGVHVGMVHDGGIRAYRLTHGLTMSTPLVVTELGDRLAEAAVSNGGGDRIREASRRAEVLPSAGDPMILRGTRLR